MGSHSAWVPSTLENRRPELVGQPFVSVDRSNWSGDEGHVVVMRATAGKIKGASADAITPAHIQITPVPRVIRVVRSLIEVGGQFEEEPPIQPIYLPKLHEHLAIQRPFPNYDARVAHLLDTSDTQEDREDTAITVAGRQIDRLLDVLGRSRHPLSGHAAAVIQLAVENIKEPSEGEESQWLLAR